ncbi:UNVERIFIED_CONTAM: hypothetical protein K2H54_031312 [Gekko kuhli]
MKPAACPERRLQPQRDAAAAAVSSSGWPAPPLLARANRCKRALLAPPPPSPSRALPYLAVGCQFTRRADDSFQGSVLEKKDSSGGGPETVIVPVLFGLIFLLGMVGNTLVLVVLGRLRPGRRPSRSATNIFILNLSIADFSFLIFCVPFQATIYSLPEWVFGAFFCKWVHYLAMATMLVSIFTLVAMSVDRYIAVVHAKRSLCIRSKRNATMGVAVIWVLSLLFAIPVAQHQALVSGHFQAPNSSFCWEQWAGNSVAKQIYKVTILVVGYLLPLMLITCCYAKVGDGVRDDGRGREQVEVGT